MSLTYPGTHPSGGTGDGGGVKQLAQRGADQRFPLYITESGESSGYCAAPKPVIPAPVVNAPEVPPKGAVRAPATRLTRALSCA
jgi:hypothetical protein